MKKSNARIGELKEAIGKFLASEEVNDWQRYYSKKSRAIEELRKVIK